MPIIKNRHRSGIGVGKRQQGFLLPVALVLIIGIAALAAGMSKLNAQSNISAFREGISMQTFYAAESGMQFGMNQLMFPSATRAVSATNCANVNGAVVNFSAVALSSCSATISCASSINAANSITFFTLTSAASCGSGELVSERTIQASAYVSE